MASVLERRLSRRSFINAASAAGLAVLSCGYGGSSPKTWQEFTIPADNGAYELNFSGARQKPPGAERVYIGTSSRIPGLLVCVVWNRDRTKTEESSLELGGELGFQPLTDPFRPDTSKLASVNLENYPKAEWAAFPDQALSRMPREVLDRLRNEPSTQLLVARPGSSERHALVLGEGLVELDHALSPLSYFSIAFRFRPLPVNSDGMV